MKTWILFPQVSTAFMEVSRMGTGVVGTGRGRRQKLGHSQVPIAATAGRPGALTRTHIPNAGQACPSPQQMGAAPWQQGLQELVSRQ